MPLDEDDEAAHAILDRFRSQRIALGPVALSHEYLAAIEYLEHLPENASGADKTWLLEAERAFAAYHAALHDPR